MAEFRFLDKDDIRNTSNKLGFDTASMIVRDKLVYH